MVSASAGSGKTEVLARRCVSLLARADAPASLDRMLIVTFTRAAASELRERIGRMLRAEAADTANQALRLQLLRQERLLDAAEIGTIDAWCGRLVRRNFEAAGVDPGFTMLSPQAAILLRNATLDQLFDDLAGSTTELSKRVKEWMRRQARPTESFFRGFVEELSSYREHLVDPEKWLSEIRAVLETPSQARLYAAQVSLLTALRSDIVQMADAARELAVESADAYQWIMEREAEAQRATDPDAFLALLTAVNISFPAKPRRGTVEVREAHDACRKLYDAFMKQWDEVTIITILATRAEADDLTRVSLELEALYNEKLHAAKEQRQAYEFGDVLRMALNLLQTSDERGAPTPTPLARRLQTDYQYILVDEFQDTNPIQDRLFQLVSRPASSGNLFTVGDIKQSIYGFRRAEPRLFSARLEQLRAAACGGALFLSENFRSHPSILSALNLIFSRLFSTELGGTDYGEDEHLRPGLCLPNEHRAEGEESPRVKIRWIPLPERSRAGGGRSSTDDDEAGDDDNQTEDDTLEKIQIEARVIADEIQGLLAAGTMVADSTSTGGRPLGYGDIAVLLRSAHVNSGLVAGMLRNAGIPAVAGGRESIFATHEVNDVINVLRLIVNEDRDVVLAAHLRSPMVGLTARELLAIRAAMPAGSFIQAVRGFAERGEEPALRDRLAATLRRLERWRVASRTISVPLLLNVIIRETNIDLVARGRKLLGEYRLAAMSALRQLAESQEGTAAADFVMLLDRLDATGQEPESVVVSAQDAVRIMTIHGSKGLEFPIVFVANLGARWNFNVGGSAARFDDDLGAGVSFFDTKTRRRLTSVEHFLIKGNASSRDREEELRLLYVAATRAREALFLIGHADEKRVEQYPGVDWPRDGALPLWRREKAGSMMEWVLMATAATEHSMGTAAREAVIDLARRDLVNLPESVTADAESDGHITVGGASEDRKEREEWSEAAVSALLAARAVERDSPLVAMSVSSVKQRGSGQQPGTRANPVTPISRTHELPLPQVVEPLRESPT
ncbi:MAG: UvrD-helicase domain-containing protein, partial [Phycisphaerae bacterium]